MLVNTCFSTTSLNFYTNHRSSSDHRLKESNLILLYSISEVIFISEVSIDHISLFILLAKFQRLYLTFIPLAIVITNIITVLC